MRAVPSSRPRSRLHPAMAACRHAVGLAAFLVVMQALTGTWGGLTPLWGIAGVGFALLCAYGRSALWGMAGGVALWTMAASDGQPVMMMTMVLAVTVSQWLAWRRVKARFASTSQPFARQHTTALFLRVQCWVAAPLAAALLSIGASLVTRPTSLANVAWQFAAYWVMSACGAVLCAPLAWEGLMARSRGGLLRFVRKQIELLPTHWRSMAGVLLLSAVGAAQVSMGWTSSGLVTLSLLAPVLALEALRVPPVTLHALLLLAGTAALSAAAHGNSSTATADVGLVHWVGLAVLCAAFSLQLLLVTAHERRLALKRLERQAETDPLTNLLSLSGLYRKLEEMSDRSDDESRPISTLGQAMSLRKPALISVHMTNADSLEQLLGARQCDVVERAASGALTAGAPQVTWARVSKAHFVGVLADYREGLHALLTQLNFTVQEARALLDDSVVRPMWAVAAVTLDTEPLPPIEVAMACLRRAEQTALDTRQIIVHPVDQASGYALKMEAEQAERIRQIIQHKRLVLFAQPIVSNSATRQLRHKYEILIRLHDEQGNVIPPALFLPIAMRAGLMQLLDAAVMEQTFEWFADHPKALARLSHCAINLSGPTVAHPGIAARIAHLLAQYRLPPEKFTFEITESQAIANPEQASETIRAIRACGCRVAIDDFGTGVATFDYLKRFDVDYIKIDGAFITSLLNDPVDRVIVESIVRVARQLRVRTIAEFVSSQDLHAAVTALGVDESQGYAFGAPRPLHEWFS